MKEPLDFGNEHQPRRHQDQELIRWITEEFIAYHGLDEEEQYDYGDKADFSEDHKAGFAQDAAADHQEQHEYGDSAGARYAGDKADFSEDHKAGFAQDAAADHQEQHEYGDSAGARYAAAKFPEFRRRSHGLINGEPWKPPYQRRRFMPVFKRLNPAQPDADPGYDDWIPYHEEEQE